jgi:uncharacterized protein YjbJ (UPF0337 family)
MGIEKRLEAAAKNIEGVFQEAAGELTGNKVTKAKGQVKQEQAAAMHKAEDVKDKAKRVIDRF